MIVQCEQCQTRFRIPDEKVTDKGVRVRCTKCQHTFRVERPPAAAQPPAPQASPAPARAPGVFDEPTRIGTLSGEELARLGLASPPPAAPPRPPPARPAAPATANAASPGVAAPAPPPLPASARPPLGEGLRRAAGVAPAGPAGAVALSPAQAPAAGVAPPAAAAPSLSPEELFGSFGDVDLGAEPAEPPAAQPAAAPAGRGASLLGELEAAEERGRTPSAADLENARALFDLPRREVLPPLPPPPAREPSFELELALPPARQAEPPAPIPRPAGRPEDVGMRPARPAPPALRRALGHAANLAVALLLVLGLATVGRASLREGRLELGALAPARLGELLGAPRPLVLHDVANGLYDTRDGRAVFYVHGEVENRGAAPARVRVRAALYDGAQRVKSAEGLAGRAPSPEALYSLGSHDEALALRSRLDAGARVLAPGERAPFTLVFDEYPPELGDFRLELTPEALAP